IAAAAGTVRGWDPKKKEAIVGKAVEVEALRIPGRGLDFAWVMTYRSRFGPSTAQGNGWDFSHDVWIERPGPSRTGPIVLHDGTGRSDRFERQADGTYSARGFFLEGRESADGTFTFTFPDGGTWTFRALDGTPAAGRISSIRDRNGNELKHVYQHNQTNLEFLRIRDTLGREITAAFGPGGMIASVTDFTGRRVTFEYYQDGDAGGSAGDLRTIDYGPVTVGDSPPQVRTTTFTYSKGFADDRLNHNLLTVTDAKGQRALTISYSPSTDPADPGFDRIASWIEGEGAARRGLAHVTYGGPLEPLRAIAVDLAGNVDELTFDAMNRLVRLRQLTGRSDPSLPLTDTENRPVGKLRPGDPDFFESRFEWNEDSLLARRVFPETNNFELTYEGDLDPTAPPRSRGNLRQVRRLPGARGGDPAEIVERFEHDARSNQVARAIDGRGSEARFEYDARGNLVRFTDRIPTSVHEYEYNELGQLTARIWPENVSGERRREEYEYYGPADGPENGYLKRVRLRLTPFDSEVGLQHDARGNITQVTDPRGNVWEYAYNELDELVRVTSPTLREGTPHRFVWNTFRDRKGNIVREDVLNVDARGTVQPNTHLSAIYEHDALDRLVRLFEEVGSADLGPGDLDGSKVPLSELVATEYEYDAAGNLALVRPVAGADELVKVTRLAYDERDLLFRCTRGAGSADAASDQVDYDGNGNKLLIVAGLERPAGASLRLAYDGHDRLVRAEDALGSSTVYQYDANGNAVVRFRLADSTGDPADVKVELERTTFEHDAMDRLYSVTGQPTPVGESASSSYRLFYSNDSQVTRSLDGNGNETRYAYDAVGRLSSVTDALGNTSAYEHDASSNNLRRIDTEQEAGAKPRSYETRYAYDELDRRVAMTDSLGNTVRYAYDSRSNLTEVVNALGDATRYEYDGLGRLTAARRALAATPNPGAVSEIIDRFRWDSSSRLVEEVDPNGNAVRYAYDALDRRVSTTLADGSAYTATYDVHDNPVRTTDPNGTVVIRAYDRLHRLVRASVAPGPGVSTATTFEELRYDGLSRLLSARNDASVATFAYDSLSRITRETLDGRTTAYTYDAAGNVLSMTYPGGTVVRYAYDASNRVVSAGGGGDCCNIVKSTEYAGPGRVLRRSLANSDDESWSFDGARRATRVVHERGTPPAPVSDRAHTWDAMYRQVGRASLLQGGSAHEYAYDAAHRLIQGSFGVPGAAPRITSYLLDPAGNRTEVAGSVDPGPYVLDPTLPEPADFQVNQYTRTPFDERAHDRNGNLTLSRRTVAGRIVEVAYAYDHADRLVEVLDPAGETVRFTYDALGRRSSATAGSVASALSYQGERLIEDGRKGAVYVYAGGHPIYIQQGGQDLFLLGDGAGKTVAVTDGAGNVVETCEYGDFGMPRFFDAAGNPGPASKVQNPFLLEGLEHDAATGLYYSPEAGVHFDPRSGSNVNRAYKLQSGFIYSSQSVRGGIPGHGTTPKVSDFGLSRDTGRSRKPDTLVFNLINPRGSARHVGTVLPAGVLSAERSALPASPGGMDYQLDWAWREDLGSAGKNDGNVKLPGQTRYSNIVLKRGLTKSKAFFNWVASSVNREVKRMGGKIALSKREGTPVLEWTFEKGWPVRWEGPDLDASKNEVAIETLEIAHEGLALESHRHGETRVQLARRVLTGGGGWSPTQGRLRGDRSEPAPFPDNGWGSCFNCHPFGLTEGVSSASRGSRDSEQFQSLTNVQKTKHDTVKSSINNVR
ncbi:MAG: phage tail protein, partial [Planctomycetes bacterium]|nr:phage tail protein [Planctomycetota bacterium]